LDPNESSTGGNGSVNPGLFEYVTVYSREPNFHSDGTALTNATTNLQGLRALLRSTLGTARADQIWNNLNYSRPNPNPASNLLDFYVRSGMTSGELGQVMNGITFSTSAYTRGRVNINTASAAVLTAVFMGVGIDQNTATGASQQLVNYREQNPNNLASIGWLSDSLGTNNAVVVALRRGDYITTRSFQFTADIAATGPFGRGYRRVKFVFDVSDGTPKVIYRQDLSRLGWALGAKTRETWVTQNTR
jgi:hypothetical protein